LPQVCAKRNIVYAEGVTSLYRRYTSFAEGNIVLCPQETKFAVNRKMMFSLAQKTMLTERCSVK